MFNQIGFGKFIIIFKFAQKHSLAKRGVFLQWSNILFLHWTCVKSAWLKSDLSYTAEGRFKKYWFIKGMFYSLLVR